MIVSFQHKGLEVFYKKGSTRGIQASHAKKLNRILTALDVACCPADMDIPSFKLHPMHGDKEGYWSVWDNGNWRVTFRFIGTDVELVNYTDYH
jgi:proteic killer suppression protein